MSREISEICDKACFILRGTNDGNDLSPKHFYLLECAVNNYDNLTDEGKRLFDEIYEQVKAGTYVKPWHFGVEGVTKNHEGYIYWRGKRIEHYGYQDWREEKADTERLAAACLHLEATGRPVTFGNYLKALDELFPKEASA